MEMGVYEVLYKMFFRSNYQALLLDTDPCPYCYNKIEEIKSCLLQRERGCSGGLGDCGGGLQQDSGGNYKGSPWALLWFYNFCSTSSMPGNATFGKEVGASDKKFVEDHFKFVKTGQVNLLCRF